ncbi:MAG: hypothetical protein NVS4B12_24620 [Ktedonobacteraceae bacterium]
MSNFTQTEIDYLQSQRLGRLATVNEAGEPHVVPVSFRYNAELDTIDIGGHNMGKSKKFRDAAVLVNNLQVTPNAHDLLYFFSAYQSHTA